VLSAPIPPVVGTPTGPCACPHCFASWDEEVTRASSWLGAGSQLEGLCDCGSYLVWERRPRGSWTLASWVPPNRAAS
jgi:hypothetical protein